MQYTAQQIESLESDYASILNKLESLLVECSIQGERESNLKVREHLHHGAGRRLKVMRRALANLFRLVPLAAKEPPSTEALADAQINLHAFVINLYGFFENLAWAFVHREGMQALIDNPKRVSIFQGPAFDRLPNPLRAYLTADQMSRWIAEYLKHYRDALVHRIPLYIPPADFTIDEGRLYNDLESKKLELIKNHRWEELDVLYSQQAAIGEPSFVFLQSVSVGAPLRPVLLHPQIICDALTVEEFGRLFFKHWRDDA